VRAESQRAGGRSSGRDLLAESHPGPMGSHESHREQILGRGQHKDVRPNL